MSSISTGQQDALASLQMRWAGLVFLCALSLFAGFLLLSKHWQAEYALRWLSLGLVAMIYLLWMIRRGLPRNHRAGDELILPTFGAGNALTIFRGILLALLAGFLLSPSPTGWLAWIPASLYSVAVLLDYADGYLARTRNHATRLGEDLDMNLDGLGVLTAALLAVLYGQAPVWYLAVGLARYFFIAGAWLRKRLGKPVFELPQSISRRAFAGAQMGFIAAILFPVFSPPGTHLAATLFALPFLVGFCLDWLSYSGFLAPATESGEPESAGMSAKNREISAAVWEKTRRWAPVFLRVLIVCLLGVSLASKRIGSFLAPGSNADSSGYLAAASAVIVLQAAAMLFLALGAAGRMSAVAVLISIGIHQRVAALGLVDLGLIACAVGIFFFGTGAYSLWSPEDRVIYHKPGESRGVGNLFGDYLQKDGETG